MSQAGAGDTFAVFYQKQRAVGEALDHHSVEIKELVLHPVQLNAEVGAAIAIQVYLPLSLDGEVAVVVQLEASGGVFGQLVNVAKYSHRII